MNKRSPASRGEVIFVTVSALVAALLCALGINWYLNRDDRWFRIATPPNEAPSQIIAFDRILNVYVRTRQGNVYLCGGQTWRDECHAVAPSEVPVVKVPVQWSSCASSFPQLPAAPGVVMDTIDAGRCLEAATYSRVVLLSDGTLWQWRRTFSWANQFAAGTCVILGLGIGIAGGILVVKMKRYLGDA